MTICSLNILLSLFETSLLFHVQISLLLPDLHADFSGGRSGGLIFPSLLECTTEYCDPHKVFGIFNKAEIDFFFLGLSWFFDDPVDIRYSISGYFSLSKTSLNICKFIVHVFLKPGLENFEHYFISM